MSRKSKLILATALFGAALFAASCGGGDNGGTTPQTGTGGGGGGGGGGGNGGPPPPTEQGKVLALLDVGTDRQVRICGLLSNGTAQCGNNLNPDNVVLDYVHEFPNGNVVLRGSDNFLYFFNSDSSTLTRLTSFRNLNNVPNTVGGITIPTGSRYYATPNFLFIYFNTLVAISRTGNVIMDDTVVINGIDTANSDILCERVTRGGITFRLNVDGTASPIPATSIPRVDATAGGKFLVSVPNGANRDFYLSDSRCELVNSVLVMSAVNNFNDAKMVEFGGSYYIAIRYGVAAGAGRLLDYYRVTGTTRTQLYTNNNNPLNVGNPNLYDIDSGGYLYFNVRGGGTAAQNLCGGVTGNFGDNICVVTPTGATLLQNNITGNNNAADAVNGILAFNDRVLVRATPNAGTQTVYDVSITGAAAINVQANPPGADLTALQRCTDGNTRAVNGRGTSLVRCVEDNLGAGGERLVALLHNGSGVYTSSDIQINNTSVGGAFTITGNNIRFGANNVLVPTRAGGTVPHVINLCSISTSPTLTVSCSLTDLPNPVSAPNIIPLNDRTRIYPFTNLLKFNGNNVFYLSGVIAPFIPKSGDIFSTPQSVPILINSASGGNASFDLTRFAHNPGSGCITSISYLNISNAFAGSYTVSQPSGACVNRILKVY